MSDLQLAEGYTLFLDNGSPVEVVKGHVDAETFNRERDKHCNGDPVEADELEHQWAELSPPTPEDEVEDATMHIECYNEPKEGRIAVTVVYG